MPFNGLTPFLLKNLWKTTRIIMRVSMPFNGLTPFLPIVNATPHDLTFLCQCPLTGLLHFYILTMSIYFWLCSVSMPFNGLTPFLQIFSGQNFYGGSVSMPFNGLTPFLPLSVIIMDGCNNVSMPFNGLTPFLLDE